MKKLIATLVAVVFLVGFTFAQTNHAYVTQVGATNHSTVDQTGSGNHVANVNQYGSNWSEVSQSGGTHNIATVDQGTNVTSVTNNHQPGYLHDWQEGAFITQIGSENDATITMTNNHNFGQIFQSGDYDHANQTIGTYYSRTNNNTLLGVRISQTGGDHNSSEQTTVATFGNFGIQNMTVTQEGNYNVANQYSIGGMNDVMKVSQTGDNNNNSILNTPNFTVSGIDITNPLSLPWAHLPAGTYAQYAYQENGHSIITVVGSDNNTVQYQETTTWGGGANQADITINGDLNNVAQGQLGVSNQATTDITGSSNRAVIGQHGDNNDATITITTNNDVAGISQINNGNVGTISQSAGDANFATINQH